MLTAWCAAVLEVAGDSALRKIERAATVEASAIRYDKRELLRLVHAHLASSGLHRAAQVLLEDAGIEALPGVGVGVGGSSGAAAAGGGAAVSSGDAGQEGSASAFKVGGSMHQHLTTPGPPKTLAATPRTPALGLVSYTPSTGGSVVGGSAVGATDRRLPHSPPLSPTRARDRLLARSPHRTMEGAGGSVSAQQQGASGVSGVVGATEREEEVEYMTGRRAHNTLDGICRAYLRQQHAECRNPIRLLPPLSLLKANQPGYQACRMSVAHHMRVRAAHALKRRGALLLR